MCALGDGGHQPSTLGETCRPRGTALGVGNNVLTQWWVVSLERRRAGASLQANLWRYRDGRRKHGERSAGMREGRLQCKQRIVGSSRLAAGHDDKKEEAIVVKGNDGAKEELMHEKSMKDTREAYEYVRLLKSAKEERVDGHTPCRPGAVPYSRGAMFTRSTMPRHSASRARATTFTHNVHHAYGKRIANIKTGFRQQDTARSSATGPLRTRIVHAERTEPGPQL